MSKVNSHHKIICSSPFSWDCFLFPVILESHMTCWRRSKSPICHVGKASQCPLRKVIFMYWKTEICRAELFVKKVFPKCLHCEMATAWHKNISFYEWMYFIKIWRWRGDEVIIVTKQDRHVDSGKKLVGLCLEGLYRRFSFDWLRQVRDTFVSKTIFQDAKKRTVHSHLKLDLKMAKNVLQFW